MSSDDSKPHSNYLKGETSGMEKRKYEDQDIESDSGDECLPLEDVVSSPSIIIISSDDDVALAEETHGDQEQGPVCVDDADVAWGLWVEQYRRDWDDEDTEQRTMEEEEEEEEGEEGSSHPLEDEFDEEVLRHANDLVIEMELEENLNAQSLEGEGDEEEEEEEGEDDDGDDEGDDRGWWGRRRWRWWGRMRWRRWWGLGRGVGFIIFLLLMFM